MDNYNKLILEADSSDFNEKARLRAIDATRVAKQARDAANTARTSGKDDLANRLEKEAEELEQAAAAWNQDTIDSENNQQSTNANADEEDEQEDSDSVGDGTDNSENDLDNDTTNSSKTDNGDETKKSDGGTKDSEENKNSSSELNDNSTSDNEQNNNSSKSTSDNNSDSNSDKNDTDGDGQSSDDEDPNIDTEKEDDDEDDPIKDIFNLNQQSGSPTAQGKMSKEPRDPTADEIIKMLSKLSGEAKRGAHDGLQGLLSTLASETNEKTESLHEAFNGKGLRELTDDEFADGINKVIDMIDEVDKLDIIDSEDKKKRLDKIQQIKTDPALQKELQKEDNVEIAKDFQKKKARDRENDKYAKYRSIEQFKINFYNAINDQVEMMKVHLRNYSEINPEYEDENIITKADIDKNVWDEAIPTINFYFDCSGSWTGHPDAVEIGKAAVATVKEFEDRGEIKLNVLYFGQNSLSSNMDSVWGGGTKCWNQIIQNIKATEAKNVVLMTDCDMSSDAKNGPVCKVDGSVWFIWSLYDYSSGSKEIVKHLIGRGSNNQYAFGQGGRYPEFI